jgi:hypothetical protein
MRARTRVCVSVCVERAHLRIRDLLPPTKEGFLSLTCVDFLANSPGTNDPLCAHFLHQPLVQHFWGNLGPIRCDLEAHW